MAGFYGFVVLFDACVHVLFFEKKLNNSVHDHGQKPLLSTVRDTPSGHGYHDILSILQYPEIPKSMNIKNLRSLVI